MALLRSESSLYYESTDNLEGAKGCNVVIYSQIILIIFHTVSATNQYTRAVQALMESEDTFCLCYTRSVLILVQALQQCKQLRRRTWQHKNPLIFVLVLPTAADVLPRVFFDIIMVSN